MKATCDVCGEVPRSFWTFGGGYWRFYFGERLCPGCASWLWKFLHRELVMEGRTVLNLPPEARY